LGGNGLVSLQVFDWGIQIGPPERSVLAKLFPPARLEWVDIESVEYQARWSSLRFECSRDVPITFYGGASLEAVLNILQARGLMER
jgi:hypothetical protein